jgi:hypothetical protein
MLAAPWHVPLPLWAWTALLIGAAICIVIDRILDGPRDD